MKFVGWFVLGIIIAFPGMFVPGLSVSYTLAGTKSDAFVITSDRLEMDGKKNVAIFFGDVRAEERQMRLSADKMIVHYYRSKTASNKKKLVGQGGIHTIKAKGHVVLVQGKSRGTAEEMVYKVKEQTLEMLGMKKDASIRHGNDRLQGKKILLTLGSDRSILRVSVQGGGRRRVSARITPSGVGFGGSNAKDALLREKDDASSSKKVDDP